MASVAEPYLPGEWTDRNYLRRIQYPDGRNLAARQSIYAFQVPKVELPRWALDKAGLSGRELVADIGCGNGAYLTELARRGHAGPLVGVDLSEGMAREARAGATGTSTLVGDASRLPLRDASAGVILSMHMLYHVPDRSAAVAELRRVVVPGGPVLVVLNGSKHLHQLRALVDQVIPGTRPLESGERLDLDAGEALLKQVFGQVERHEVTAQLVLTSSEPLVDYVLSMNVIQVGGVDKSEIVSRARSLVDGRISETGSFRIDTHSGCFVCRQA